jgi:hypothetical protein
MISPSAPLLFMYLAATTGGEGSYVVRSRGPEYVLCVKFKGKLTHHLIKPNPEGIMTVNGKAFGSPRTLDDVRIFPFGYGVGHAI